MKSEHKRPVSLEDLMRLKRAERPSAEFWPEFEKELRAKQLAALVVHEPWWRTFPLRAWSGLARYHLPLGASAVLALTFLSVKEYRSGQLEPGSIPNAGAAEIKEVALAAGPMATDPRDFSPQTESSVVRASENERVEYTTDARAMVPEPRSGNVSAMSALVGESAPAENPARDSALARSMNENFPAFNAADAPLNRALLSAPHGFESRAMPARAVDPLAQVTPPTQVRRDRFRGTALPASAAAPAGVNRSSDRLVSRLSDDRLYDSMSRYAFGGEKVSLMLKF